MPRNLTDGKTVPAASTRPLIRLVDDNADLLESLEYILRCEGYETAAWTSAAEFLKRDTPSRPGCIILDVKMPEVSGIELQYILNTRGCRMPIIFLTAHGDIDMAVAATLEGAVDFLQKPVSPQRLLQSVSRAVALDLHRRKLSEGAACAQEGLESLTERERSVLELVARGMTSREISDALGISRRTVEHHRADGQRKLGATSPAELAVLFADATASAKDCAR